MYFSIIAIAYWSNKQLQKQKKQEEDEL